MNQGVGASAGRLWQANGESAVAGRSQSLIASVDDGVFQLGPSGAFVAANDAPATADTSPLDIDVEPTAGERLQWALRLGPKSGEGTTFTFTLLAGGENDG